MSTSKETNSMKKLKAEDQSSEINNLTIEYLNNDCLLEIFQYLTFKEKIRIESVCKNWNQVIKLSWNQLKSLQIHKILPYRLNISEISDDYYDADILRKNTRFLVEILKRSSHYLQELTINTYRIKNLLLSEILFVIPEYCRNLNTFDLQYTCSNFVTDENLKNIFRGNPNISNISFQNVDITGDCLKGLNIRNIKKIILSNCRFKSPALFYAFIGNLKNLTNFCMIDNKQEVIKVIDALIIGNSENISDIELRLFDYGSVDNLVLFVSQQKKINRIKLCDVSIDQQLLENLPIDTLEELNLSNTESNTKDSPNNFVLNISLFLSKQKNIRKLTLINVPIIERLIENEFKSSMPIKFLEEFTLEFNDINLIGNQINLSLFLYKHKKIRILKLKNVLINEKFIWKNVYCPKIVTTLEELSLEFNEIPSEEIVSNVFSFLCKLEKINKLRLQNIIIDEKMVKNLPTEGLIELDLDFDAFNDIDLDLKFIDSFQNIETFKILTVELKDEYLDTLTKYINENVRNIEIYFGYYLPSNKRINNFSRLLNLQSLIFHNNNTSIQPNIDNLLKYDLSKCKNLNYLSIEFCEVSNLGLNNLSNLLALETKFADIDDEVIVDFLKNAMKLKEIKFEYNCSVTHNLIKKASKVKVQRGDTHELKIFFDDECSEVDFEELKNAPLVKAYCTD